MDRKVIFPDVWVREARAAYRQYVGEWEAEELERMEATGESPEPPQMWDEFFCEYLYAELESCTLPEASK